MENQVYTYENDVYLTSEPTDFLNYGPKSGPMDWLMALYLLAIAALEPTQYYFCSTYLAYGVFAAFIAYCLASKFTGSDCLNFVKVIGVWLLLLFLMWGYYIAITSSLRMAAISSTWFVTKIHIMAIVLISICNSFRKFILYLKALIIGASVLAISGTTMGYSVAEGGSGSQLGLTEHGTAFGIALFIGFISALILLPVSNKKWKIIIWVYFIGAFISLLVSASRGATVACFLALLAYLGLEHIRHIKSNLKIILPASAAIILAPIIAVKLFPYSPLVIKMTGLVYGDPGATHGRLEIYAHAWSMFLSRPFKGIGLGMYRAYSPFVYTHTTFLEILVTLGLPGFFLYYSYYLYGWRLLGKAKKFASTSIKTRKLINVCRAVLLAILAYGAFAPVIYQKGTTFIIAMIIGVMVRLHWRITESIQNGYEYEDETPAEYLQ